MPHLLMEYSDNVRVEPKQALQRLNRVLMESGEFEPEHIKSRARCCRDYCVGDDAEDAFVHLTLSLLSGRSMAVKAALSAALAQALEGLVQADVRLQLTVDVRELERAGYARAELPAGG